MSSQRGSRFYLSGAWILIALGSVHSMAVFNKPVPADDTERKLIDLMANYRQNIMGSMRSTADILQGFNVSFVLLPIALGTGSLLAAKYLRGNPAALRSFALFNVAWLTALLVNSLVFWFAAPTTFIAASWLCFGVAWLRMGRSIRM